MPENIINYRNLIHLDEPFIVKGAIRDNNHAAEITERLCRRLIAFDRSRIENAPGENARHLLYRLLITRPPVPFPKGFLDELDLLLQYELRAKKITETVSLPAIAGPVEKKTGFRCGCRRSLWKGDITTLKIDAVVNAANSSLLGCFLPDHRCIDNAIHAAAGPRLREDCRIIMEMQGEPETTGNARITRAYNLPSSYVIHTVGPIYREGNERVIVEALASCYRSCLDAASLVDEIRSIAFCSISTGVFGFPAEPAAEIALGTVGKWLGKNPKRFDLVVFNLFSERDYDIFTKIVNKTKGVNQNEEQND